jgi:hypothetical protein
MDNIDTLIIQGRHKLIPHCHRGLSVHKVLLDVICEKHMLVWYCIQVTSRYKNYLCNIIIKLEMHVNKTQTGLTRLGKMRMEWVTKMPT